MNFINTSLIERNKSSSIKDYRYKIHYLRVKTSKQNRNQARQNFKVYANSALLNFQLPRIV